MSALRKCLVALGLALATAASPIPAAVMAGNAVASEIKLVVNRIPITSYDIQRRAAFMKLQGKKGNLNAQAEEEMIEQALRLSEARRIGVNIPAQAVDQAFANFARSNKMTTQQLEGIMNQSGVTSGHFKEFIRSQMGWNQVLSAWTQTEKGTTEQKAVRKMLQQGSKPSATEYMLQQVIFVVPAAERGKLAQRKREAEALRARYNGCESTREFVKGLIDVTVRDLGRKVGPELPQEWAEQIKATKIGGATAVRETERGVEFIGICSAKEVSDDRVATMVLQQQGAMTDAKDLELNNRVIGELRKKAKIERR
jgi:peptidyl-prolyl cis-trans isomerase SurA